MFKLLAAGLAGLGALAGFEFFCQSRGDCRLRLAGEQMADRTLHFADAAHACLRFSFPFCNSGSQQALLIDASACLQPAGEHFSELQPVCRLINPLRRRTDGYWDSCTILPGEDLRVFVELWLTSNDIRNILSGMSELRVDVYFKFYGRTPMLYRKEELFLDLARFETVQQAPAVPQPETSKRSPSTGDGSVLPLRTRLLRPGDDLVDIIRTYTRDVGQPGDLVAIAESAVAIVQGRLVYCEDVRPRYLARRLNRLFGMHSSLSSPYALEMAMQEVGAIRILAATAAGFLGRIVGRQGDFYRVAGREVATIDDCTGTLPPFDKHVVLGPARGAELVDLIKRETGYDSAIVDANDLGKVDVLHCSDAGRVPEVV
ncbi:MAG: coenzyme F420-0:L-glutamate ligase, partial [Candidatus Eremiobacterota bacterium]